MSEFPFQGEPDTAGSSAEGGRGKRTMVLGGVLAAAVLAAGGYVLLGVGGDDAASFVAAPGPSRPAVGRAAAPGAPAVGSEVVAVPAASTQRQGRNPFKALVTEPVTVASTGPAAPSGSAGTPAPPAPTGPTTAGSPSTEATTYPLKLVSIGSSTASFLVDGQAKQVLPGQRFGKHGELVVLILKSDRVVLQVGDGSAQSVKTGATVEVL